MNDVKRVSRRVSGSTEAPQQEQKPKAETIIGRALRFLSPREDISIEEQKERFQQLQTKHAEHQKRLEELTKDIVTADDISEQMKEIETVKHDLKACQTAMDSIKKNISETLQRQAHKDYKHLPEMRAEFDREFGKVSQEAGVYLSRAVQMLQQIGFAFHGALAQGIVEAYNECMRKAKHETVQSFCRSYVDSMNAPVESVCDFKAERERLDEVERLGSLTSQEAFWKRTDIFLGLFQEGGKWPYVKPWQPCFEEWLRLYPESAPARRWRKKDPQPIMT